MPQRPGNQDGIEWGGTRRNRKPGSGPPQVRFKLHIGEDAIGPGKIDLLRGIDTEGGISSAARKMGITFRRAWYLIDTVNSAFGRPVVTTEVGGAGGGGARLTDLGRDLIEHYDALIEETEASRSRILAWVEKQKKEQ